jgi:hypothetical protein
MMAFELSVKSVIVKEFASEVTPVIVVIDGAPAAPAADACVIALCSVGSKFVLTAEAFNIAFEDRHLA